MKIEKDMVIRCIRNIGRHKEDSIYKVVDVGGQLAFAINVNDKNDKMVLYRYSELVEEVGKGVFYV